MGPSFLSSGTSNWHQNRSFSCFGEEQKRTSVHWVFARPLNNRACLFFGGVGVIFRYKGSVTWGSFNHMQTIRIVSAPQQKQKKEILQRTWKSQRLFSTLEASDCNEFWHRPLKIIFLTFARGWMASKAWKWEKLDKIREAVGLGGPLKLLALSLSSTWGRQARN